MTGNFWDPAAVTGIFTDGFESGDTARWTSFQSPQSSTAGRTAFQIPKMLWHEQVGERDRQLRSRWLRAGNRASNYWQDLTPKSCREAASCNGHKLSGGLPPAQASSYLAARHSTLTRCSPSFLESGICSRSSIPSSWASGRKRAYALSSKLYGPPRRSPLMISPNRVFLIVSVAGEDPASSLMYRSIARREPAMTQESPSQIAVRCGV